MKTGSLSSAGCQAAEPVYHDLGNLNFSFITKDDGNSFHNFKKFTEPVVAALKRLGVDAEPERPKRFDGKRPENLGKRPVFNERKNVQPRHAVVRF